MFGGHMNGSHHNFDQPDRAGTEAVRTPGVVIVSNVLLYREGLAASLSRDGRLEVIAALGAADAFAALSGFAPDAVLLDASMEEGLALARSLRANRPNLRLVGFGVAGGANSFIACAESGLVAFVDRNGTVSELVTAVQGALRGELKCSPRVTHSRTPTTGA